MDAKEGAHLERMAAKAEVHLERMEALLGLRPWGEVTEACPKNSKAGPEEMEAAVVTFEESSDKMEIEDLEENSKATEAVVKWQELRNEQMNVDNIGSLEDRHDDRHLVVRRRRRVKKPTQGNGGVWQKLAAARKRMIRSAVPEVRKGHSRKGPAKDNVARGAPKGRTLEKIGWAIPKCKNCIWARELKEQLHVRVERTSGRIFRKTIVLVLVIENRKVGPSIGLREMNSSIPWKVRPPPQRKELPTA
jgi:hypothetical protein